MTLEARRSDEQQSAELTGGFRKWGLDWLPGSVALSHLAADSFIEVRKSTASSRAADLVNFLSVPSFAVIGT